MDGPWQGSAQLRMVGESAPGQPREVVLAIKYRLSRPTEENLRSGWLRTFSITQSQAGAAPHFLLHDAGKQRGLDVARLHDSWTAESRQSMTGGVFVTDYDRDGILDVLVTDSDRTSLYKGLSDGQLKDVTRAVGLPPGWAMVAVFVDLDDDGFEDLVLDRKLFRNDHGRGFTDVTESTNLFKLIGREDVNGFVAAD